MAAINFTFSKVCRYDSEGSDASVSALRSDSIPSSKNGIKSVYSDCVQVSYITSNLHGLRRNSLSSLHSLYLEDIHMFIILFRVRSPVK